MKVENLPLPVSGTVAFCHQKIKIGSLTYCVAHLSKKEYDETKPTEVAKKKNATATQKTVSVSTNRRTERGAMKATDANVEKKASGSKNALRATLMVTSGPHHGDNFVLEEGLMETLVIGSAPTVKGERLVLSGLAPNQVRLDFKYKGNIAMVKATDLAKSNRHQTLFNNGKPIASGKSEMMFQSYSLQFGDGTEIKFV